MTDLVAIIINGFWCGWAALGFSILFNAPTRSILPCWIGGFVAGLVKFSFLASGMGAGIILSSFLAGISVSIVAIPLSKLLHLPVIVISIPSIIPLIPGVFAYRSMMGLMKLARNTANDYSGLIAETVYNGVMAFFVIMAIALGLAVPLIIMRFIAPQYAKGE